MLCGFLIYFFMLFCNPGTRGCHGDVGCELYVRESLIRLIYVMVFHDLRFELKFVIGVIHLGRDNSRL